MTAVTWTCQAVAGGYRLELSPNAWSTLRAHVSHSGLVSFSHKAAGCSSSASLCHARAAAHRLVAMIYDTAGDLAGTDPLDVALDAVGVQPGVLVDANQAGWVGVWVRGADRFAAIAPYFGDALEAVL